MSNNNDIFLPLNIKRKYFHNDQLIFQQRHLYENIVRSSYQSPYLLDQSYFQPYHIISRNTFTDNSVCDIKSIDCFESIHMNIIKNSYNNFNHYHLKRNKDECLVVIGDDILHPQDNLESTLEHSFASHCAMIIDSDCYVWQIQNSNNTLNVIELEKILTHLSNYNYQSIKIIFQFKDPVDCIQSRWWNCVPIIEHCTDSESHNLIKNHLSYNILDVAVLDGIIDTLSNKKNLSNLLDSFVFKYPNSDKPYFLSPQEFFELYESTVTSFLSSMISLFGKKFYNIDILLWKDYCNFENNFSSVKKIQKSLVEFTSDKKLTLQYSRDKDYFYKRFVNNHMSNIWNFRNIKRHLGVKYINNPVIMPVPKKYEPCFADASNKFETGDLVDKIQFSSAKAKSWAHYLINESGWHK